MSLPGSSRNTPIAFVFFLSLQKQTLYCPVVAKIVNRPNRDADLLGILHIYFIPGILLVRKLHFWWARQAEAGSILPLGMLAHSGCVILRCIDVWCVARTIANCNAHPWRHEVFSFGIRRTDFLARSHVRFSTATAHFHNRKPRRERSDAICPGTDATLYRSNRDADWTYLVRYHGTIPFRHTKVDSDFFFIAWNEQKQVNFRNRS